MRLVIVLGTVLAVALIFDFTALSAVVVVMPLLVVVQFLRHPGNISTILKETMNSMIATADDILIITMAMLIGYFAIRTGAFSAMVANFYDGVIPGYVAIIITPLMMLASVVGVHPVISSAAMLAVFSGGHADAHPALMQAHLIGWAGTLCGFTIGDHLCKFVQGAITPTCVGTEFLDGAGLCAVGWNNFKCI